MVCIKRGNMYDSSDKALQVAFKFFITDKKGPYCHAKNIIFLQYQGKHHTPETPKVA